MSDSTSPASMGGPLSEAEGAAARIRAYLEACSDANSFGREIRWELRDADGHPYNLPRADLVAVLDALGVLEGQLATAQRLLDEQRGATRVAAAAADRFRDVLSEALGHPDNNPGDDVLVTELRKHFGFSGPEPTRWRDFLTGARAQIDQIEADRSALGLDGGDPDER